MEHIKSSKLVGEKGVAIHNGMKLKVTVVGEFFSHNKSKLYCTSEGVAGKFMVLHENVVFKSDFK